MMNELRQLALDNDTLNSNMDKLKQKHEHSQHELKTLNNKIIGLSNDNKKMKKNNSILREKIKHSENTLQSLKSQYTHEIRKKEIELQKLKEKLQKRFSESMSNSNIRYHIANPLSRIIMNNDKKSSNEDMFSILISNYENSEKELHNENCLLRQTLYDIYKEVELILGVEEGEKEFDPNNADEVTNILVQNEYMKPEDAQFKLPLSISREYLGQRINDLLEQFKEYIFSIQEETNDQQDNTSNNDDKLETNMQIDEDFNNSKSNNDIKEQEKKLVYEELKEEYLNIKKQKTQLESERQKYTEAAAQIEKERTLLSKEKESIENERRKLEEEKSKLRLITEASRTPINNSEIKSNSPYSINNNLNTPVPAKFTPNLNKSNFIDSPFNPSTKVSESPLSSSANTPVMLRSSKTSRSLKNINNDDEFLIRNEEKDEINAMLNQALERINRNKQSFLSLSKTYNLKNNNS